MTESLHAKPGWFSGRALPCNNSWHTENRPLPLREQKAETQQRPCQPPETHFKSNFKMMHNKHPGRRCCALAQTQMFKHHCTNIYIFQLNIAKLLSPPQDHMASSSSSLSVSDTSASKIKSHIPDHKGPSLNPRSLLFSFHAAAVQRASWRLLWAHCVLVEPQLSHTAEELLIAPCSPVV